MKRTGPDSLTSWLIASACCFINIMMFGLARLSGILFVASGPRFMVSREKASFPYTFASFMRNAAGPLVGFLSHRYDVRSVTTIGCIMSAAGVGACFFAENIDTITVLWGVIFGLGFGLGNVLLPLSINQHFDKNRASASGLSYSGACIGSFILPPIVDFLINTYGLSGTYLFLCGFLLNCLPAALLLKKPEMETTKVAEPLKDGTIKINQAENQNNIDLDSQFQEIILTNTDVVSIQNGHQNCGYDEDSSILNSKNDFQILRVPKKEIANETHVQYMQNKESFSSFISNSTDEKKYFPKKLDTLNALNLENNLKCSEKNPVKCITAEQKNCKPKSSSFLRSLLILIDPMFNLIAITGALYCLIFVCTFTIVVDFARDLNIGKSNEKYILMSLSIGDLIGRLGLGWVTDGEYMTTTGFTALLFAFQGIAIAATAWASGFVSLVSLVTFYGLSEAGIIVLLPILIAENMDYEQQLTAIPYSVFFSGPVCLAVSPMIGYFRDNHGTYEYIFYILALISFACSLSWILAPYIRRCRKKH